MSNNAVVYDIPTDEAIAITEGLMRVWQRLGKPDDLSTSTGWIMLDNIMQVWHRFYPHEVDAWRHDLAQELSVERSVRDAVKQGGYTPISYPPALFGLIKSMFPTVNLSDRKFVKKMVRRYPILKSTNYKV